VYRAGAIAIAFLEGMDAVEPHAPGLVTVGVEVGQWRHVPAGVPFLARGRAGVAADTDIEVDDEAELLLPGVHGRQIGHGAPPCCPSPPKFAP
jgi:hypothetical protein